MASSRTDFEALVSNLKNRSPQRKPIVKVKTSPTTSFVPSKVNFIESDSEEDEDIDEEQLLADASVLTEEVKALYQVQALGDFDSQERGDLSFKAGEILQVLEHSRDDEWLLAENALGQQGTVPSNHLQRVTQPRLETPVRFATPIHATAAGAPELSGKRSGKQLWDKIRSNVKQTSLADVLSALGAIPAGFRESTLGKLYNESEMYWLSSLLHPKPNLTITSFADLKWDHSNNQVVPQQNVLTREFSVIAAKMIPLPGRGLHVLSRHVRVSLFNKGTILSNIHTVRAVWNQQADKMWSFIPKTQTASNNLFHRVCIARSDSNDPKLELLFELNITYKREKTGEVGELSCGWTSLPLYDHTGGHTPNRTYELKVHGGTPFEAGVEVDPAQQLSASGSRRPSILRVNQTPRLYVQLVSLSRERKLQCSVLPSTIVTNQQYVHSIGCFRHLVGQSFIKGRYSLPLLTHVNRPSLNVYLKAVNETDVMDSLLSRWKEHLQLLRRIDRINIEVVSQKLEQVLLEHVYPLLYSTALLPLEWGNEQREKERYRVIEKYSRYKNKMALLASDTRPSPMTAAEQAFTIYP